MSALTPKARKERLVTRELPEELLVYDLDRHKASCLNRMAMATWRRCDGQATVPEIAEALRRRARPPRRRAGRLAGPRALEPGVPARGAGRPSALGRGLLAPRVGGLGRQGVGGAGAGGGVDPLADGGLRGDRHLTHGLRPPERLGDADGDPCVTAGTYLPARGRVRMGSRVHVRRSVTRG